MKSLFKELINALWTFSPMIVLFFACGTFWFTPVKKSNDEQKAEIKVIKDCSLKTRSISYERWAEYHS